MDRLCGTVPNVITDQFAPNASQSLLDCRELPEHIGAITISLYHVVDSTDLALDAPQPREVGRLDLRVNGGRLAIACGRTSHREFFAVCFRHNVQASIYPIGYRVKYPTGYMSAISLCGYSSESRESESLGAGMRTEGQFPYP
jgi:hypothetical protein